VFCINTKYNQKTKLGKMKKLLLVLAIGAFAACNDNTEAEGMKTDTVPVAISVDTNTTVMQADTTVMVVDTLKK